MIKINDLSMSYKYLHKYFRFRKLLENAGTPCLILNHIAMLVYFVYSTETLTFNIFKRVRQLLPFRFWQQQANCRSKQRGEPKDNRRQPWYAHR